MAEEKATSEEIKAVEEAATTEAAPEEEAASEQKSIFDIICDNIEDGHLAESFSLSNYIDDVVGTVDGYKIRMADGAMDGICIYHVASQRLPKENVEVLISAFEAVCDGDYDTADEVLEKMLSEHSAIYLIDQIQEAAIDVAKRIGAKEVFRYAILRTVGSTNPEMVKFGLSICELMGDLPEDLKDMVRILALCDEFTIFCAWNARNWENANDELFEMAREAKGWGRIHVIKMLEPETEEIREWLLYEGVNNGVMPEYTGMTCYEKADVAKRLEREMGHDEFSAITAIVSACLCVEPVCGFPCLNDPKSEVVRYVKQASRQTLDRADCRCLETIAGYAKQMGWEDVVSECDALLESDAARALTADEEGANGD